jgi:threonine aldolase
MRTAMFEAEVGDDVFGEDPTIQILENKLSHMFQKENALFFPSGTMSNLAATMSWCGKRGSEMIMGDCSHTLLYEQGGVSQLAGVVPRSMKNERDGTIAVDSIEKAIRQSNIHFPVTELIALEDTHNFCGGRVLPRGYLETVGALAKSRGIKVHLDGARIWNAATASQTSLPEIVKGADSVSVCLSKGLGAPSGSVLLGPHDFIEKARRCRKSLGGGMRQVGILAAAGLQALRDYESGILLPDHAKAKLLANAIAGISGFSVDLETVDTNIVLVNVDGDGPEPTIVATMLKERGILCLPFGERNIRLVTHRDIVDEDVKIVLSAFRDVALNMWPQPQSQSLHVMDTIENASILVESNDGSVDLVDLLATGASFEAAMEAIEAHTAATDSKAELNETDNDAETVLSAVEQGRIESVYVIPAVIDFHAEAIQSDLDAIGEGVQEQLLEADGDVVGYRDQQFDKGQGLEEGELVGVTGEMSVESLISWEEDRAKKALNLTSEEVEFYEESVIYGMSLSDDGFCVLLKGLVCDRVLRVLVTPPDPMAYGLDRDQVETPEAVTLLQLWQGIDVESILARDALAVKFAESGSGRQQYVLQRVMIDNVATSKMFECQLQGSLQSSIPSPSPASPSVNVALPITVLPQNADPVFETLVPSAHSLSPAQTASKTQDTVGLDRQKQSSDGSRIIRDVELNSAFEAIALTLRHGAVIEVRSSLLQDDHFSYRQEELPSYFPKMVKYDIPSEENEIPSAEFDSRSEVERLQRRLYEAIRQRNTVKIETIKKQLEFYSNIEGKSLLVLPPTRLSLASVTDKNHTDSSLSDRPNILEKI